MLTNALNVLFIAPIGCKVCVSCLCSLSSVLPLIYKSPLMALSAGNLANLCRVCAGEFANMINLFSVRRKGMLLAEMLSVCVQNAIDQSDTMPQKICAKCLEQLCAAYVFCRLAQESDAVFKELIDSPAKPEMMSDDDFFESADTLVDLDESSSDAATITVSTPETAANARKAENINVSTPITRSAKRDIPAKVRAPLKSAALTKPLNIKPPPSKDTAVKVKSARKAPSKEFECYLCKAKPGSLREAKRHLRSHDMATPHQCQICSMRFSSRGLAEHSCDGQSIECAYCPAVFRATMGLLQHLDEHKQHQKLHKCTECAKMFAMPYLLELHKRQHNDVEKKFACDVCGRRFKANHELLKHRRTHSEFKREFSNAFRRCTFVGAFTKNIRPIRNFQHICAPRAAWASKRCLH